MEKVGRKPEPGTRGAVAKTAEPRWAQTNRLTMEQSLLELSGQHGEAARGASEALTFLAKLQAEYLGEDK